MAGNACVIKCSEHVAWSTSFLQEIFTNALKSHGYNPDLVRLMNGFGETGEALVEAADKITFIGSPNVGKLIMKNAATTLTPVVLELGGKDCAVVFEDAYYENFATQACRLGFQNAGQNCAGLERVIIHESLHDQFVEYAAGIAENMRIGSPLDEEVDLGAIVMNNQVTII
jgi:acyl-CoA reductase-like NAD-dependent aldehyde dehydrogenase